MTVAKRTRVALVTGGSRGLGRALCGELVARGWHVVADARDASGLAEAVSAIAAGRADGPGAGAAATELAEPSEGGHGVITPVAGDVTDPEHRRALAAAVARAGGLDLLVNNASALGPSPMPRLADYAPAALERVFAVNAFAPLALLQELLPQLEARAGRVIAVSSDAAVEAYEGWGGYGAAKAALDQLTAVLAVEHPGLRVYGFDPGDMATDLAQQAFPGEDMSDRASPESVVPALMRLIEGELDSGRYRAEDLSEAPRHDRDSADRSPAETAS